VTLPSAADYRQFVGLPLARGGEGGVPVHYTRVGQDRYIVSCLDCARKTPVLTWAGANSASLAHRCLHARLEHGEASLPVEGPVIPALPA